jgi:hypothetical protein
MDLYMAPPCSQEFDRGVNRVGYFAAVKRLLVLCVLAALCVVLARRVYARSSLRQHGTPDHWPAVPRKA